MKQAMTKILCDIYKSRKKDGTYLYVSRQDGLKRVPEVLLESFGKPELSMTLMLHKDKKLARADVEKVLQAMHEHGFYLQLPPLEETSKLDLFTRLDIE